MNTKSFFPKKLVLYGALISVLSFACFANMSQSYAQDVQSEVSTEDIVIKKTIEEYMVPGSARDCAMQSNLFIAASEKYKEGVSLEEAVKIKMFQPLFDTIYKNLREKGYEDAAMDNLKNYQTCIQEFADQDRRGYTPNGCTRLTQLIIDTLQAVKKEEDIEKVVSRYGDVDLSDTQYEEMEQPQLFFIGKIYDLYKKAGFENAVLFGTAMAGNCAR